MLSICCMKILSDKYMACLVRCASMYGVCRKVNEAKQQGELVGTGGV